MARILRSPRGRAGLRGLRGLRRKLPVLTFRVYEPLPGCCVGGGELFLDFGDIFRMQVVKQTLTNQVILWG